MENSKSLDSYCFSYLSNVIYNEEDKFVNKTQSPNNIKTLVISKKGVLLLRHCGSPQFKYFPDVMKAEACLNSSTHKRLLSALSGANNSRVCSNIEEIVLCAPLDRASYSSLTQGADFGLGTTIMDRGTQEFNYGTGNKFKRLRYISVVEADFEVVKSFLIKNANSDEMRKNDLTLSSLIQTKRLNMPGSVIDLHNTRYYEYYSLRPENYEIDADGKALSRHFQSLESTIKERKHKQDIAKSMQDKNKGYLSSLREAEKEFQNLFACVSELVIELTVKKHCIYLTYPDQAVSAYSDFKRQCPAFPITVKEDGSRDFGEISNRTKKCLVDLGGALSQVDASSQGLMVQQIETLKNITQGLSEVLAKMMSFANTFALKGTTGNVFSTALASEVRVSCMDKTHTSDRKRADALALARISVLLLSSDKRGTISKMRTPDYWEAKLNGVS